VRGLRLPSFLLITLMGCRGAGDATFPGAPLVLISIDTLRADHLPAYGYKGVDTPNIDGLRKNAILFENAYSHCPLTLPSHASILTGLLPSDHGVRDNLGYRLDTQAHPTLAALLKAHGYATGAAVSAYVLRGGTGLADSFDFYDDEIPIPKGSESAALAQRRGGETAERALGWLRGARAGPFFLFFHIYEPHLPYDPPEPFKSRYPLAYDGEIATADAIVGDLLKSLRADGVYDKALIVLLSDHGEGLDDHGEADHGILLYREVLRVPLILKLPRSLQGGTTISRPVQLIDVLPTLLSLLALRPPEGLKGTSLLSRGPTNPGIYSETYYPRIHLGWSELRSLVDDRYHFIDAPSQELYELATDPGEKRSILKARERLGQGMKAELERYGSAFTAPKDMDPGTIDRLRSLGYLGGVAANSEGTRIDPKDHIQTIADIKRGFSLAAAGKDREALAVLQGLLKENPNVADVQFKVGEILQDLGRSREALEAYKAVLRIAPSLSEGVAIPLAQVNLQLGELDAAAASARLALRSNPREAHLVLAKIALERNDLEAAAREAKSLEGEGDAAVILAEVSIRRNEVTKALELLDATKAQAKEAVPGLEFLRGDCLARMNRLGEAEAAFRQEIAAFPKNSETYARLAIVLALKGHTRREVYAVLESMAAANPGKATDLLAAKTLESMGDKTGTETWRRRAAASP
jgi:choline-sulfatase